MSHLLTKMRIFRASILPILRHSVHRRSLYVESRMLNLKPAPTGIEVVVVST